MKWLVFRSCPVITDVITLYLRAMQTLLKNRLVLSPLVYAVWISPLLALTIAFNDCGGQNILMPFGIFMFPAVSAIWPPSGERPPIYVILSALLLTFIVSLVTYPLHAWLPDRVPEPHKGPKGWAFGLLVALPVVWMVNSAFRKNTSTPQE